MTSQITFTRFLAAFWVMAFHLLIFNPLFKYNYIGGLFKVGSLGVSFFFVLSGFVMILAYYKSTPINIKGFYRNRFFRIYPLYFASVILSILVGLTAFDMKSFIINLSLTNAFFLDTPNIFALGWSLTVEVLFYLLFPFILLGFKQLSPKIVVIITIIIWLISNFYSSYMINKGLYSHDFRYHNPIFHLNQFLVGMAFAIVYYEIKPHKFIQKYSDYWLIFGLMLLLYFIKITPTSHDQNTENWPFILNTHNGIFAPIFGAFIYLLAINEGLFKKIFSLRPCVFLGEISYATYLLHGVAFTILAAIYTYLGIKDIEITKSFVIFMPIIAIIVSALGHILIEKKIYDKYKTKKH